MKFFALVIVVCVVAGCGEQVKVTVHTEPRLRDAWLSSDAAGESRVTSYAPTDTVHAKADLVDAPVGTEVVAKLVAVEVDHPDVAGNTEIGSFKQVYDGKLNRMNFEFSNDGPMPSGSYKVELSIPGQSATSLPITIVKSQ
ncbi:MAG: hypothetical protein AB8G99_22170 [Planctomycetaceae bacterium]